MNARHLSTWRQRSTQAGVYERAHPLDDGHPRFLRDLLGDGTGRHEPERDPDEGGVIPLDEPHEGGFIARTDALEQCHVIVGRIVGIGVHRALERGYLPDARR